MSTERELREQWQALHLREHAQLNEALVLARADVNRRLDSMNQLREQITGERTLFLTRDIFDREHNLLRNDCDRRLKALENRDSNLQGRMLATGALISMLVSIVLIVLHFFPVKE